MVLVLTLARKGIQRQEKGTVRRTAQNFSVEKPGPNRSSSSFAEDWQVGLKRRLDYVFGYVSHWGVGQILGLLWLSVFLCAKWGPWQLLCLPCSVCEAQRHWVKVLCKADRQAKHGCDCFFFFNQRRQQNKWYLTSFHSPFHFPYLPLLEEGALCSSVPCKKTSWNGWIFRGLISMQGKKKFLF